MQFNCEANALRQEGRLHNERSVQGLHSEDLPVRILRFEPLLKERTVVRQAAIALIERADGRFLAVWNPQHDGWGLPGGKVEVGETPIQALQRELREETTLGIISYTPIYENVNTTELDLEPMDVFVFKVTSSGTPAQGEADCPIQWLTRDELISLSPFSSFYLKMFSAIDESDAR
jgi:8-oxo-dGTP diphosphatase